MKILRDVTDKIKQIVTLFIVKHEIVSLLTQANRVNLSRTSIQWKLIVMPAALVSRSIITAGYSPYTPMFRRSFLTVYHSARRLINRYRETDCDAALTIRSVRA